MSNTSSPSLAADAPNGHRRSSGTPRTSVDRGGSAAGMAAGSIGLTPADLA
jgi:hypothetical protein